MTNSRNQTSQSTFARLPNRKYEYDPLPGRDYIRTATILPGKAGDDIIIELATVPFLHSDLVEYTALSYAWGSPELCIDVEVRTNDHGFPESGSRQIGRRMGVSLNLATALRDLRLEASSRTMWIDAICIDQSNHEEKAVQVSKIGSIFRRAAHVIAYIGPEIDDSTKQMEYLEHVGKHSEHSSETDTWNLKALRPTWNGVRLVDGCDNLLVDSRFQDGLYKLFSRPWFERLWIRQEIFLSEERAIVTCGRYEVHWEYFRRAWFCLYSHFSHTDSLLPRHLGKLWRISSLLEQHRLSALRFLRDSFRGLECTDPRDRLFAVLELLPEDEKRLISVDYTKLPEEVYRDAALGCINQHRDLTILQECQLEDGWAGPSWVPNWGASSQVEIRAGGFGVRMSRLTAILDMSQAVNMGALRAVGIEITIIQDLRPSGIDLDSADLFSNLRDLFDGIQMQGDYVAGGSLREAYATAILRGKFARSLDPESKFCCSIDDAVDLVRLVCSPSAMNSLPLKKESVMDLRLFCAHRQLLRGSNGYVGMAPQMARKGDRVYTIVGCDCPLILRHIGEGKMQVVGSCYIPGAMENQALLGPLPADVEAIYMKAADGCLAFRDRLRKRITYEDPRLSSLPLTSKDREHLRVLASEQRERLCMSKNPRPFEISLESLQRFNSAVHWVQLV